MKRIIYCVFLMSFISLTSFAQDKKKDEPVMTKNKKEYVINTTTLCKSRGFRGSTPLLVTIVKNKIQKVEALANQETPKFFQRIIQELLPKYNELELDKTKDIDCITGATLSSRAVKDNVDAAIKYYNENK